MNLEIIANRKKEYRNNKRFYTSIDMAIIKKDAAGRNALIKRGVLQKGGTEYIVICGCGKEGCFIHCGHNKR